MSGGHWEYKNNDLSYQLFGWRETPHYGMSGFEKSQVARNINPMDDREVSELLWDMMCLLHSKDYYESGDIGKNAYKEDLEYFKNKWFKRSEEDTIKAYKKDLKVYADELLTEFDEKGYSGDKDI